MFIFPPLPFLSYPFAPLPSGESHYTSQAEKAEGGMARLRVEVDPSSVDLHQPLEDHIPRKPYFPTQLRAEEHVCRGQGCI